MSSGLAALWARQTADGFVAEKPPMQASPSKSDANRTAVKAEAL
jgi:hypothetical protein